MTELAHYVELVTDTPLAKEDIKGWLDTVTNLLPAGLTSSIGSVRQSVGVNNAKLIHRKTTAGKHKYIIPLVRNLTEDEFNLITRYVVSPDGERFEINTSEVGSQSARQLPRFSKLITDEQNSKFAEEIAKIQHNNWKDEKSNNGWQYGVTYNPFAKQSPMIKDWKELPQNSKYIDYRLPKEIISIIESYGYSIIPNDTLDVILSKYDNRKTFKNFKD